MTVQTETRVAGPFSGDGVTTSLPFDFVVFEAADLIVIERDDTTGDDTVLVLTTDYSVTLNPDQDDEPGGTITLVAPLPSGATDFVYSDVAALQEAIFTNTGGFYPAVLNTALDKLTVLVQQIKEAQARSVLAPVGETAGLDLPPTPQRAGLYLAFDASGNLVTSVGTADGGFREDAAQSTGAALIGWIASGLGAVVRSVLSRLRDTVHVTDYGAVGDGVTDDAVAIRAAIAAASGKTIFFPDATYKIGSSLGLIPTNTKLQGQNKATTKLLKSFNGTLLELGDGASLDNLWLAGQGATYTGKGVEITGANGNQNITNCKIIDFENTPLHFTTDSAGSRFNGSNIEVWRTGGTSGSGKYGIVIHDSGAPGGGHPMSFHHIETGGYESISFGSCNDLYITGSTLFDCLFSVNSRSIDISSTRIASTATLTLRGSGSIVGCNFGSAVVIEAGAAWNIGPGFFNAGYTDNAVGGTLVFDNVVNSYTPTFKGGGVAVTLGNGSVSGKWTRVGNRIHFDAKLVVGTTTVIPAGAITVTLPEAASASISAQSQCSGRLNTGGSDYLIGAGVATGGTTAALVSIVGALTNANPVAYGGGTAAVIEISGSFTR